MPLHGGSLTPEQEQRLDLVVNAHLFGHFGIQGTLTRLQQDYYWKNMFRDVTRVCKACATCHSVNASEHVDSPARPTTVSRLFEKVGMDLVLGFPEDDEGHCGCLVLTEYLSKYPMVYPIKSKSAEEIAKCLLDYIGFFGPPEVIVSDQGTEFVNAVVRTLLQATGVEQRVTSSYFPRSNGHTERFNQTLVRMLRKLSEDEPRMWRHWIPFAMLAYRSKVNAATGTSPYSILFGVPMRGFQDFGQRATDEATDEATELGNRMNELRLMVTARDNQAEELQRSAQKIGDEMNARSRIVDELAEGTMVYMELPRKSKFKKSYSGPYQIVRKTRSGNYAIKSLSTGTELPQSVPLAKLKVVSDAQDFRATQPTNELPETITDTFEIEAILDHKEIDNQLWYLLTWKGYPTTEDLWVPESDCQADELIAEYWLSRGKCDERESSNHVDQPIA